MLTLVSPKLPGGLALGSQIKTGGALIKTGGTLKIVFFVGKIRIDSGGIRVARGGKGLYYHTIKTSAANDLTSGIEKMLEKSVSALADFE